jgi:hypothetical protein
MRRIWNMCIGIAVAAAVLAGTGAARGQDLELPRHRQGYYLAFGLQSGPTQIWDHGESLGSYAGSGFNLRIGQLITRRIGLGVQLGVGGGKKKDDRASTFGVGIETELELATNLAVHAGAGLGVVQLKDQVDPDAKLRGGLGARYTLGLSYDWFPFKKRKSGGFSLTPNLGAQFIPGDGATSFSVLLGVGVGWWTGLPRNQLQLPESEAY